MNAQSNVGVGVAPPPSVDTMVAAIAREFLGLETLKPRGSDAADWHNLAVWTLHDALEAAYVAGQVEARARLEVVEVENDLATDLAYIETASLPVLDGYGRVLEARYSGQALWVARVALCRRRAALLAGKISGYDIPIDEFNSAGIRAVAAKLQTTHMRKIGGGYLAGHEGQADYFVGFYALPEVDGTEVWVANTNGDPVWEFDDPQAFADLAEACGVNLEAERGPTAFSDEDLGFLELAPVAVLLAAAGGRLDLNRLALERLARSGVDRSGAWVGFKNARALWLGEQS